MYIFTKAEYQIILLFDQFRAQVGGSDLSLDLHHPQRLPLPVDPVRPFDPLEPDHDQPGLLGPNDRDFSAQVQ